ncbi:MULTISPECIES: helix-turn-helix transcriptional regulator [Arthrobacter]|uniref:XRE family transcriptional regulator n=1 Tax=Arthrobacter terricola TaxID=2547396 RepID=A0A4R5K865_9MICC|nr:MULTISPECIES: helix-turn-helix transcriptional regulator [Arthrobacter]MBT8163467.1 helix-turn-helix domain-containing protein [Arthrobacter sp. GN70]TDF89759.1 XRE family transcriptional regulator [Arthrobacter terricola]
MDRHSELSAFLRLKRASIQPGDAGIGSWGRRRVSGLRREEVAQLSGVSTDYYRRLEQGKLPSVSESVLGTIAGALQLDQAERDYLFNLARPREGHRSDKAAVRRQSVRPEFGKMMAAMVDQPAFVLGRRMDFLAGNPLALALLTDFSAMPEEEQNMVRWMILDPSARTLYEEWASVAEEMVGVLRADAARFPDDVQTARLVGELAMKSEEFRIWWADRKVHERTSGSKSFMHPVVGGLEIDYEALNSAADPDQVLFIYTARNAASLERLRLLSSWSADAVGPARYGPGPQELYGSEPGTGSSAAGVERKAVGRAE